MRQTLYQNQSPIFERIIRQADGKLFRVQFVIVERGGVLRGKIISCEEVGELTGVRIHDSGFKNKKPCLLLGSVFKCADNQSRFAGVRIVSPYFSRFEFLTSIKIRAPSLRTS